MIYKISQKCNGRSSTSLGADKMFAEEAVSIVKPFNTQRQ